jgi:hypothetical protein
LRSDIVIDDSRTATRRCVWYTQRLIF